jgi:hypothetical protein
MKDDESKLYHQTNQVILEQLEEILQYFPKPDSVKVKLKNVKFSGVQEQLDDLAVTLSVWHGKDPIKTLNVNLTDIEGYLTDPTNNEIMKIYRGHGWHGEVVSTSLEMRIVCAKWLFDNNYIEFNGHSLKFYCDDIPFRPELDKLKQKAESMWMFPHEYNLNMFNLREERAKEGHVVGDEK